MKNKRNTFLTVTAATLAVSAVAVAPASAANVFTDVNEKNAHFEGISALYEAGIIKGYPDGTFKPGQDVTRGQAAKMIAGALKLNTTDVTNPNFADIDTANQYYGAIAALAALNVIDPNANNTFRPNETITRAEMAKMLVAASGLTATGTSPFTDVPADSEYASSVTALFENGVMTGISETEFGLHGKVTRGQLATFIMKAQAALVAIPEEPKEETTTGDTFKLSIMHVNDTHAKVEELPKLATAVKELRAEKSNTLLLHAGDVFSGTLYFTEFQGKADIELLNMIDFDAMVLGNHEFDLGSSDKGHQALVDFIKAAKFPIVDANIDFSGDDKFTGLFTDLISSEPENGKIYSGIVKEINGEKVGIFGLTTAETENISSPNNVKFENYIEEAKKAVKAFEGMGVNKIIALTHIGFDDDEKVDNDKLLAQNVEGIDIIVGGHTHTQLDAPEIIKTNAVGEPKDVTLIVQAKNNVDYLGTLDVSFDGNGVVTEYNGQLIGLGKIAGDKDALKLLAPFKEKVDVVQNKKIGVTIKEDLITPRESDPGYTGVSVRNSETALGNIITDGMLAKAQQYTDKTVIMALQNGGGIRVPIPAGEITVGQVISVLPFANTLAIMDITGADLKAAFENSVKNAPKESGGFLHISGAKLQYDSSKQAGSRVVSIEYLDKATGKYVALEDDKTYTIATNAFTAQGAEGYETFGKAYKEGRVTDLGLSDWENLMEHLQSLKEVKTTTEGRIVDISAK